MPLNKNIFIDEATRWADHYQYPVPPFLGCVILCFVIFFGVSTPTSAEVWKDFQAVNYYEKYDLPNSDTVGNESLEGQVCRSVEYDDFESFLEVLEELNLSLEFALVSIRCDLNLAADIIEGPILHKAAYGGANVSNFRI